MKGFSIQFASQRSGVSVHLIRAWEKRYQAVVPSRDEKGRRFYSQEGIERLKKLKILTEMGSKISEVAPLKDQEIDKLLRDLNVDFEAHEKKVHIENLDQVLTNLTMALRSFKLDIISHELDKINQKVSPRDFGLGLVAPLLAEVGRLVNEGSLNVAQEHALSALLKFYIGKNLYASQRTLVQNEKTLVFAAPEGELHEFGLMIGALLCLHYHLNFFYFGASMPADALAESCNQIEATHLILGVSQAYSGNLAPYLFKLEGELDSSVQILVGGVNRLELPSERTQLVGNLEGLDEMLLKLSKSKGL